MNEKKNIKIQHTCRASSTACRYKSMHCSISTVSAIYAY